MALLAVASIKQGPSRDLHPRRALIQTSPYLPQPIYRPEDIPRPSFDFRSLRSVRLSLSSVIRSSDGMDHALLTSRGWPISTIMATGISGCDCPSLPIRTTSIPFTCAGPYSTEYAFLTFFLCALESIVAIVRILSFCNFMYPSFLAPMESPEEHHEILLGFRHLWMECAGERSVRC